MVWGDGEEIVVERGGQRAGVFFAGLSTPVGSSHNRVCCASAVNESHSALHAVLGVLSVREGHTQREQVRGPSTESVCCVGPAPLRAVCTVTR